MLIDGTTGTEVNKAFTSYEEMTPLLQFNLLYLLYEVLSVFEVVLWLAHQWMDDACQLLSHPICDGPPAGHYGP